MIELQLTVRGLAMAGQSKHFRSANVQKFNRSTKVQFCTSAPLLPNPCWVLVWFPSVCCFLFFLKSWEIFKPIFSVGFASSLAKFGFVRLACATLTMCLQIALAYILIPNFFNFFNDSYALINACSLIFSFLANAV